MKKLSSRQLAILDFIKKEVKEKGYPPSVREIGEAVGLASASTVHGHLARLEKKGLIRRDPTKPRAIEVLDGERKGNAAMLETVRTVTVPMIGKVTAGFPITAVEHIEEYFVLPENIVGNDTVYMLRIQGESMIEAGILNGDYVIVRQQQTANNGDIVVAMTEENKATVKRFFKEKDHIRLQPENLTMEPILLPAVTILGKVIGLYRNIQLEEVAMMNFLSHLGQTVEIIYMNRNGELSQRKIRVLSIKNGRIRAYCFTRKATRYFAVENVLAMRPVKERKVG